MRPPRTPSRRYHSCQHFWLAKGIFFFFFEFLNIIFLYSRLLLVIHFIHISVYMSTPISQFTPQGILFQLKIRPTSVFCLHTSKEVASSHCCGAMGERIPAPREGSPEAQEAGGGTREEMLTSKISKPAMSRIPMNEAPCLLVLSRALLMRRTSQRNMRS